MSVRGLGDIGHQLDELLSSGSASAAQVDLDIVESALIYKLKPGSSQPRKIMHDDTLLELAKSIKEHGILQPIIVLPRSESGEYEIIAGERRWRAAKLANLREVPVIIRDFDRDSAIAVSLIENIQREDLNVIDYINALHRLHKECDMTHQQISAVIGKSRVAVTNLMRLLQLDSYVLGLLEVGTIDVGHARCLLALSEDKRRSVVDQIIAKSLSVRDSERLVNTILSSSGVAKKDSVVQDLAWQGLKNRVSNSLGLTARIRKGRGKSVNIELNCKNQAQLDRLIEILESSTLD